ncbi:hypothetical protein C8J57DRAFT_267590 [Mycena rebaudengoi]|nr:hypothetical protein C8J57DRAFT_267590 [Mycena rebaudengoi]
MDLDLDLDSEIRTLEVDHISETNSTLVAEDDLLGDFSGKLQVAKEVYSEIRREFAVWKAAYVAGFGVGPIARDAAVKIPAAVYKKPPTLPAPIDGPGIDCWEYDADGNITSSHSIPVTVIALPEFTRHSSYQFCTPSSRNIQARMFDNKSAPFIPYADDPRFPVDKYLRRFESCQWEKDHKDPDDEVIQFELARRLHIDHKFDAHIIETIFSALPEFNFRPLREANASGLIWEVSQRDLPDVIWADGVSSSQHVQLPPNFTASVLFDVDSRETWRALNRSLSTFCPELNCVQSFCGLHVLPEWDMYTEELKRQPAHVKSRDLLRLLKKQKRTACGEACFYRVFHNCEADPSDLEDHDFTFLHDMLKLDPDLNIPCDLAVICRLPCWQVFVYRTQCFIVDEDIMPLDRKRPKKKKKKGRKPKHTQESSDSQPCTHLGQCSEESGCPCFALDIRCKRNCRCPLDCPWRWRGCNSTCKKGKCDSKSCVCSIAGRECDPERCTKCDARDEHIHYPGAVPARNARCENVPIQRGEYKNLYVKSSTYGLGAFAAEDIAVNECIGEYVGELIDNIHEQVTHRELIQAHSGVNYCFGLDTGIIIDAHRVGNPTRFINDPRPGKPNCEARQRLVNGDPRIAIFAVQPIAKDNELLLEYGEGYWRKVDP